MPKKTQPDAERLDRLVAEVQRSRLQRERGYRAQALKLLPWICGQCGREFDRTSLSQLTVHHKDHDHNHNPPDGSNWELLCLYCHENEHSRYVEVARSGTTHQGKKQPPESTHKPFSNLKALLENKQ